ncbi:MAG: hypothetical protein HQM13_07995 [SAR324 cluster bacterium]|nr:hypothetical protein [SAR324 cluster bacterium]
MLAKIRRFAFFFLIAILFNSTFTNLVFSQTQTRLAKDLLADSPPFLSPSQVLEDISYYEEILKESYARYVYLAENGVDWENLFFKLKAALTTSNKQILTQNLMNDLIKTMQFTKDPTLQAELSLHNRIYKTSNNEAFIPFFTTVRLAKQNQQFRILPDSVNAPIANQWLRHCDDAAFRLFPAVPERLGEERYVLGMLSNSFPSQMSCIVEDGLEQLNHQTLDLKHYESIEYEKSDSAAVFTWTPGQIPYIRWMRDGDLEDRETRRFMSLTREVRKRKAFILDVRGNLTGSFGFIARWLHPLTNASWNNAVIQEKQTITALHGILNRMEYLRSLPETLHATRLSLQKDKQGIMALLQYIESRVSKTRLIETKFNFSGDKEGPNWNKRIVVVANRHCGDGCQFLAALAKQLEDSYLVGENTGIFPKNRLIPLFQLPHSKIRVSISHRLHLNHEGVPVSSSGYEPDFWLDHPSSLSDIYRLARSGQP